MAAAPLRRRNDQKNSKQFRLKPTTAQRSMRAVKSRDTNPELAVRALLRPIAPGYRLHRGDLPGKPDVVYASRKLAIFVHGCFWHGHDCARGARAPKTNAAYWRAKIARNRARDIKTLAAYAAMGLARARRLRMRTQGQGGARQAPGGKSGGSGRSPAVNASATTEVMKGGRRAWPLTHALQAIGRPSASP